MLALVVQLFIPIAAMAQGQPASMTLCTSKGLVTVTIDADGHPTKSFAGLACQDCLASSLATLAAQPPVLVPIPVSFEAFVAARSTAMAQPRAHSPPRPPSQAPPSILA